jgi:DeoR/GlpR family transcriptional regulator of sugar metabolism
MDRLAEPAPQDADIAGGRAAAILRQRAVLTLLRTEGFVSVEAIASRFGISRMTARRDLRQLVLSGAARRTHGGAVPAEPAPGLEPSFTARHAENREAKRAIARAAAALVRPGESIGIDVGSTTLEFARALLGYRKLNVFTNSLRVAMLLADSKISTYLPGGQVRGEEMSVVGSLAVAQLQNFRMNAVFLGVSGLTPDGAFDFSLEDTEIKRVYLRCGARAVVLADASKFDRLSAVRIEGLERITTLVTDRPPSGALGAALAAAHVDVIVAGGVANAEAA